MTFTVLLLPLNLVFFTFTLKAFAPFYTLLIKGFPLQHSCVCPAARGQMIHSNLILERCRLKHETQLLHNFDPIPVVLVVCLCFLLFFSSDLIPSLLPHRALADHESRPEAALPAGLQRRAESHGEELGYRHSLRQLRVVGLRLQQLQLGRLQLSLRLGAGTSSDITAKVPHYAEIPLFPEQFAMNHLEDLRQKD